MKALNGILLQPQKRHGIYIFFTTEKSPRVSGAWFETRRTWACPSTLLHLNTRLLSVTWFKLVTCAVRLTRISCVALLSLDQGPKGLGPNVMLCLRLQVLKVLQCSFCLIIQVLEVLWQFGICQKSFFVRLCAQLTPHIKNETKEYFFGS